VKKLNRFTLASLCTLFFAVSASAGDKGLYIEANGGVTITGDSKYQDNGPSLTATFDNGYALGVAVGYDFGNNVRAEGEVAYKRADTNKMEGFGASVPFSSTVSNVAYMMNGFYDIKTPYTFGIVPYVGAGIGVAYVMTDNGYSGSMSGRTFKAVSDSGDTAFAYQVAVGAAYPVAKNIMIDLGYRYFATTDVTFKAGIPGGADVTAEYNSHNFLAGVRYKF
jgi:opacity protein-like surface antigen